MITVYARVCVCGCVYDKIDVGRVLVVASRKVEVQIRMCALHCVE